MKIDPRCWALAMALSTTVSGALAQATGGVESPPAAPRQDCRPEYPSAAARAGVQGTTTVAFHVNADGVVTDTEIVQSSGPHRENKLLDKAAAEALARCVVFVGKLDKDAQGQPIASVIKASYTWKLE